MVNIVYLLPNNPDYICNCIDQTSANTISEAKWYGYKKALSEQVPMFQPKESQNS